MAAAPRPASAEELACELLGVLLKKMSDGVPYMVWGHSVGTWVAFEYLILCRKVGLPMPKAGFFMAFPAPHMPEKQRRWKKSSRLTDAKMKQEVINWDRTHFSGVGRVVFEAPLWKESFLPLFRGDFQLFDSYRFRHDGAPKFDFPIHAWHFPGDPYVSQDMIELWKEWTIDAFESRVVEGMGHTECFFMAHLRHRYFQMVTDLMKGYGCVDV
uniref:Thioesterase domain-containing protein n=1 Tax=Pyrodinium bahamense TaxID=73915 RepID=A0A7S0FV02_9DINO